jgi:hypothetical protein
VHGAAPTAAETLGESADLRQRATQDGADVVGELRQAALGRTHHVAEGLGKELVVSTMGPVDEVITAQAQDRPDGATLLADARVGGPVHQSVAGQLQDVLLEHPDPQGLTEHLKDDIGFDSVPV